MGAAWPKWASYAYYNLHWTEETDRKSQEFEIYKLNYLNVELFLDEYII